MLNIKYLYNESPENEIFYVITRCSITNVVQKFRNKGANSLILNCKGVK